jgi:hypothetical protein
MANPLAGQPRNARKLGVDDSAVQGFLAGSHIAGRNETAVATYAVICQVRRPAKTFRAIKTVAQAPRK